MSVSVKIFYPSDFLSYEDAQKEVAEEDRDKVVIYTTSLGVNRELVANCQRAIAIIRNYKVCLRKIYFIT